MAPATWGLGNSGCRRKREAQPEKPLLIHCRGWAVEVQSHSAQPHRASQPKAPAKERDLELQETQTLRLDRFPCFRKNCLSVNVRPLKHHHAAYVLTASSMGFKPCFVNDA